MRRAALTTLVLGVVLQATAQIADPAQAAAIIAQLEDAPTSAARFNLLNGRDFVFDFNAGVGVARGAGGNITVANLADFPFLVGQGMSLAVGNIAPCGLSTPHFHPRATEFLYMISGSNLKVGFIKENGARFVSNILNPGQGAIFPKGSTHFQANLDCDPVTFVAGLNSEDPGVGTVAQRFFGIPPDVADATLGGIGVDEVVRIAKSIPDTFALGVQACLDKCKIQRGDQPKNQQQPRVGGNEFPNTNNTGKPDDKGQGDHWEDGGKNQKPPSNHNNNDSGGNSHPQPPPDDEEENDWDSDEWYDNGKWDEKKWGDDKSKWNQGVDESKWDKEKWGHKNYDKEGGTSPPSSHHWWDEKKGDSGVKKYPDHNGHDDGSSGVKKYPSYHSGHTGDGQWDEEKWGDDKSKWDQGVDKSKWDEEKWGHKNYDKENRPSPPSHHWWDEQKGDSGVKKYPDHNGEPSGGNKYPNHNGNSGVKNYPNHDGNANGGHWWESGKTDDGKWDEEKWGDDKSKWNQGVDKSKWDEEKYGWKNYKRSDVPEDRITLTSAISSLISSTDARVLEELVFFLKLILCVLLSGYVFVLAYFVIPAWKNRRLQAELQARAAASPPVPVRDVKA